METWSQLLDFRALARQYGSPLYVVNLKQIARNFSACLELVERPENILYPVKANPALTVLKAIESLGGGADCASDVEVRLATSAGFPMSRIIYNTPAPQMQFAAELLRMGATVVLDSEEMLTYLNRELPPESNKGRLFARVNPPVPLEYESKTDWEDLASHGSPSSKFGIPAEELVRVLGATPHQICGLHLHVGSQMDNLQAFTRSVGLLHETLAELEQKTPQRIRYLDFGGGLGIPFLPGQKFPSIAEVVKAIAPLKKAGIVYLVEPGHSLVGDAAGLLTRLVAMKQMRSKKWGIVDVGSDQLLKVTLLRGPHRILDAAHRELPVEGPDSLGGPLCFAGDTLLPNTRLDGLRPEDPLFISHCGAYCYAVSNSFNGRLDAAQLVVEDDRVLGLGQAKGDFFGIPSVGNYRPLSSEASTLEKSFSHESLRQLSSTYMRELFASDGYEFVSGHRRAGRSYVFELDIRGEVDYVSMPFAIRMVGDALIIATCDALGKTHKDIDIWGSNLVLKCSSPMASNRRVSCEVELSEVRSRARGGKALLAQFSLDQGEFAGISQVIF